jgi:hypothetical protein
MRLRRRKLEVVEVRPRTIITDPAALEVLLARTEAALATHRDKMLPKEVAGVESFIAKTKKTLGIED